MSLKGFLCPMILTQHKGTDFDPFIQDILEAMPAGDCLRLCEEHEDRERRVQCFSQKWGNGQCSF